MTLALDCQLELVSCNILQDRKIAIVVEGGSLEIECGKAVLDSETSEGIHLAGEFTEFSFEYCRVLIGLKENVAFSGIKLDFKNCEITQEDPASTVNGLFDLKFEEFKALSIIQPCCAMARIACQQKMFDRIGFSNP